MALGSQEQDTCVIHASDSDISIKATLLGILAPAALELFLYGIFMVLFSLSIYVFRRKYMPGKLYVVATILFFLLATSSIVLDLIIKRAFVLSLFGKAVPFSYNSITFVLQCIFVVSSAFGDLVLMYRCYLLWNSRKLVLIVPMLGFIATFIATVVFVGKTFQTVSKEFVGDSSEKIIESLFIGGGLAYFVYVWADIGQGILLTGLVAGRIWWLHRRTRKFVGTSERSSGGKSRTLLNLLEIVIESGLLLLAFSVASAANSKIRTEGFALATPSAVLGACVLTQVVGISSTLIVIRVGFGVDAHTTRSHIDTIEDVEPEAGRSSSIRRRLTWKVPFSSGKKQIVLSTEGLSVTYGEPVGGSLNPISSHRGTEQKNGEYLKYV